MPDWNEAVLSPRLNCRWGLETTPWHFNRNTCIDCLHWITCITGVQLVLVKIRHQQGRVSWSGEALPIVIAILQGCAFNALVRNKLTRVIYCYAEVTPLCMQIPMYSPLGLHTMKVDELQLWYEVQRKIKIKIISISLRNEYKIHKHRSSLLIAVLIRSRQPQTKLSM